MAIRKSWNILDVNELGMFYFRLEAFEQGDNIQILLITGDRAFPMAYAVEIRFFSIAYIGCPTYFEEEFYWRMATEEEAAQIQVYAEMLPGARVYCLEERPPAWIKRPPLKYFLAAASVEITLFYPDELEGLHSWGEESCIQYVLKIVVHVSWRWLGPEAAILLNPHVQDRLQFHLMRLGVVNPDLFIGMQAANCQFTIIDGC